MPARCRVLLGAGGRTTLGAPVLRTVRLLLRRRMSAVFRVDGLQDRRVGRRGVGASATCRQRANLGIAAAHGIATAHLAPTADGIAAPQGIATARGVAGVRWIVASHGAAPNGSAAAQGFATAHGIAASSEVVGGHRVAAAHRSPKRRGPWDWRSSPEPMGSLPMRPPQPMLSPRPNGLPPPVGSPNPLWLLCGRQSLQHRRNPTQVLGSLESPQPVEPRQPLGPLDLHRARLDKIWLGFDHIRARAWTGQFR